jgi:hypothetical protein
MGNGEFNLNEQQRNVVRALCELLGSEVGGDPPSVQQIADRLLVGRASVASHLVSISSKLGVAARDRRALAKAIVDAGWCKPDSGVHIR